MNVYKYVVVGILSSATFYIANKLHSNSMGECQATKNILTDKEICLLAANEAVRYNNSERIGDHLKVKAFSSGEDLLNSSGAACITNALPGEGLPSLTGIERSVFGERMIVIVRYVEEYVDSDASVSSKKIETQFYISNCGDIHGL